MPLTTDDIEEMGTQGIIKAIKERVGNTPTYLSLDIDVIDPSMAPASKPSPSRVGARSQADDLALSQREHLNREVGQAEKSKRSFVDSQA